MPKVQAKSSSTKPAAASASETLPALINPPGPDAQSRLAHDQQQPSTAQPTAADGSSISPLSASEATALSLSPQQRTAIEKMLTGCTLTIAADAAGVTRMTLYRWLNHDPKFQAAYNAWQQDALVNARTKLLSMADSAVNTVGHAIKSDARLAFRFLQSLGTLTPPTPGPTDPTEVAQRMQAERKKAEAKLGEDLFYASLTASLHHRPTPDQMIEALDESAAEEPE